MEKDIKEEILKEVKMEMNEKIEELKKDKMQSLIYHF
jgi:hypothetical protein